MVAPASKFEEMYKAHYAALRNVAENIIGDKDASHDIVQEVFLKVWHRTKGLDDILNQKAYLLRAAVNDSIKYLQKNKKTLSIHKMSAEPFINESPDIEVKELESRIQVALNTLPPKCKAIFVLSRFENMSYNEIAKSLEVSLKTVENQMGIALKKMRSSLAPYLSKEFMVMYFVIGFSLLVRALL